MPSRKYYRAQAQLAARLAAATVDPQIAHGYSRMALEQLAKANESEPNAARPKELPGTETSGTSSVVSGIITCDESSEAT